MEHVRPDHQGRQDVHRQIYRGRGITTLDMKGGIRA
jgi:hypothetical protein